MTTPPATFGSSPLRPTLTTGPSLTAHLRSDRRALPARFTSSIQSTRSDAGFTSTNRLTTRLTTRLAICLALFLLDSCAPENTGSPAVIQSGWQALELQPLLTLNGQATLAEAGVLEKIESRNSAQLVHEIPLPNKSPKGAARWTESTEATAFWRAAKGDLQLIKGSSGRKNLRVSGKKQSILVGGDFDPASFNLVALQVIASYDFTLGLRFRLDGKLRLPATQKILINPAEQVQTIVFELPHSRNQQVPLDELELFSGDSKRNWELLGVSLLNQPLGKFLPEGEPQLISVAREARLGLGLSKQRGLGTRLQLPQAERVNGRKLGAPRLQFAIGCPDLLLDQGREINVRVRVHELRELDDGKLGEGKVITASFPLPIKSGTPKSARDKSAPDEAAQDTPPKPVWRQCEVELASLAGKPVEIHFELQTTGLRPAVCALTEALVMRPQEQPSTVLLITSDTHRNDHVEGALNGTNIETPALLQLAQDGVRFDNCFSSTNITVPSHIALMTSKPVRDLGIYTNRTRLSDEAPTLAEFFSEAGFATYALTSMTFLGQLETGLGQGFQRISRPMGSERQATATIDNLRKWLPDAEGRPLFVWMHVFDAHYPYVPPVEHKFQYYPEDIDPFGSEWPDPDFPVPFAVYGLRDANYLDAQYKSEISYLDSELGELFAHPRLRAANIGFTADHGEVLQAHGIYWNHSALYPDTLHIPLILRSPNLPNSWAGQRVSAPVEQIDLGRTLLELAQVKSAADFGGDSLLETLEATLGAPGDVGSDRLADTPRFALAAHAGMASISLGPWHLQMFLREALRSQYLPDGPIFELHDVELYHLERDPHCEQNLRLEEPRHTSELRRLLVDWLTHPEPTGWAQVRGADSQMLQELAALGYATDAGPSADAEIYDVDCSCLHCAEFSGQ